MAEYKSQIEIRINSAVRNVSERDDVRQYVYIELIKSYKNHRKYADWGNIVLSIIKRRISDYQKRIAKTPLYHFNSIPGDREAKSQSDIIDSKLLENGSIEPCGSLRYEKSDYLENLWRIVEIHSDEFDEWELDYIGALFDAYDDDIGFETEEERMALMGLDHKNKKDVRYFKKMSKKFIVKLKELSNEYRMA